MGRTLLSAAFDLGFDLRVLDPHRHDPYGPLSRPRTSNAGLPITFHGLPRLSCMQIVRLSLLGAALFSCLPTIAQDSPMFRGNLAHTGVYNASGVPKFSKIKWKFQTGGQVISSPAVTNGAAYIASTDGNLYAVDLESGAQKWRNHLSRNLQRPLLCGGCGNRETKVEVSDRRRTAIRREASPWFRACGRNHA